MGLKKIKSTPPTDRPERFSGPAPLTHTEQKHSHRFILGIFRQKEPSLMSYTHTQNLSHHRAFHARAAFLNCLAGSVFHICLVPSASSDRRELPKRLTARMHFPASPTSQRAGHPQANDPKTSYIISTSLDIITALLLYKKHEELT